MSIIWFITNKSDGQTKPPNNCAIPTDVKNFEFSKQQKSSTNNQKLLLEKKIPFNSQHYVEIHSQKTYNYVSLFVFLYIFIYYNFFSQKYLFIFSNFFAKENPKNKFHTLNKLQLPFLARENFELFIVFPSSGEYWKLFCFVEVCFVLYNFFFYFRFESTTIY